MEIKKSPKADIENSKSTSLLIGLTVALGILFAAFEWSQSEIKIYDEALQNVVEEDEEMVEVTFRDETPPPPPPPEPETVLSDVIEIKENTEDVQTADFSTEDDANKGVEIHEVVQQVEEEEPEEQKIHVVVEKMPEFPGGNEAMSRWLSKNIKYPLIAQENNIQGRVVCQFVVNSDGKIVDVQVVRGVEASLDAEAVRVIKSMPAWTPGRQGGKNVRVKYTLPIRFKL
ncbi:MAG: energy transducer TonB [Paludibacteraceae bacterium]|nr:energy transducer TonB [Paludibacteraceae bacterium]MBQ6733028.1 energy transducer TonB [Paludibacteraceae bacterium]MBQ6765747.1 energy transducer TonB [Paludibacteraceae bacterium]MDY6374449.1 energy transducer TonB [Bacteroidales bacterium]MDY6426805.1 energy transducer TonB [Bacteroidales bacterium]